MTNETPETGPEIIQQAVKVKLSADVMTTLKSAVEQIDKLTLGNPNYLDEQIKKLERDDLYGHDISEFSGDLEALEKSGLEMFNFRVDSSGWIEKIISYSNIKYKENPEGDIIEILEGDLKGYQFFNTLSAERETKKAGKKLSNSDTLLDYSIFKELINRRAIFGDSIYFSSSEYYVEGGKRITELGEFEIMDKKELYLVRCMRNK